MEAGTIERWLKAEGDSFEAGQPLYEVQTDKVTVEVTAPAAGELVRIVAHEGDDLQVGDVVALIAEPAELWTVDVVNSVLAAEVATRPTDGDDGEAGAGGRGRAAAHAAGARRAVMPRARLVANELGVDLSTLEGSGVDGSITVEDVRSATRATPPSGSHPIGPRVRERRKLDGSMRRMGEIVSRSWSTIPQFVQHVEVSGEGLAARRAASSAEDAEAVTLGDLLLHAVVEAVVAVPAVNATLDDGELVIFDDVNVSLAVATDKGLVVPVLHRAHELDLHALARRAHELSTKARAGTLAISDVEAGTITFSNLGAAGVHLGTPLVTAPQAAIVFAGAVRTAADFDKDTVRAVRKLWLSGAFDHRIIDGMTAARFMGAVKEAVESL
jgi:pyruvate dehydrogenase E2 component (dihydrolipoamide acetyltransferase)